MTKIIFSTITLLLLLQGCGDSSSSTDKDTSSNNNNSNAQEGTSTTNVPEDIKQFASTFKESRSISKNVGESSTSSSSVATENKKLHKQVHEKESITSCQEGGTRKVSTNVDTDNLSQSEAIALLSKEFSITIDEENCIENGKKRNSSLTITIKPNGDLSNTTIAFNKDATFEDLESTEIVSIKKGSTMHIEEVSDEEDIVKENIKASSSEGKDYESIDLISHQISDFSTDSYYEVSGKRKEQGKTYRVDQEYDGSKTPIVTESGNGDLLSGTVKYFTQSNQHVTIEVIEKNTIKVSVDNDNDGTNDTEETIAL